MKQARVTQLNPEEVVKIQTTNVVGERVVVLKDADGQWHPVAKFSANEDMGGFMHVLALFSQTCFLQGAEFAAHKNNLVELVERKKQYVVTMELVRATIKEMEAQLAAAHAPATALFSVMYAFDEMLHDFKGACGLPTVRA
jgi:hypothetical protein